MNQFYINGDALIFPFVPIVITSYSIHYTKLYDEAILYGSAPIVQAPVRFSDPRVNPEVDRLVV